jgi:cobalt-zinc-cadmium efflux system outer membrane protein
MFRLIAAALVCAAGIALPSMAAEQLMPGGRAVALDEAVDRALDAAPALKARETRVEAAAAGVTQASALPNPTLDLELENAPGSGRFADFERNELTFGLRQRVEMGGKRSSRRAIAEAEREGAVLDHERARLDVVFEAKSAYFEVCAATLALAAADARLAAAKDVEAMAARRVRAARDPVTARLRAEIQTAEARTAREQALHDLHNAKRTLAVLWGDTNEDFAVDTKVLAEAPPERKNVDAASAPDVAAREAVARSAAAAAELERANASSDVTLGAGVRRFEEGGELAGVFSLSVPLAIFDGNEGNIARAAAEARAAELDVADARRRHEISLVKYEENAARSRTELETIRKDLLPRAREALAAARRGYDAGAFAYHEIAEARRILDDVVAREIAALRELHIAHAALDRLSGTNAPAKSEDAKP